METFSSEGYMWKLLYVGLLGDATCTCTTNGVFISFHLDDLMHYFDEHECNFFIEHYLRTPDSSWRNIKETSEFSYKGLLGRLMLMINLDEVMTFLD